MQSTKIPHPLLALAVLAALAGCSKGELVGGDTKQIAGATPTVDTVMCRADSPRYSCRRRTTSIVTR